jgi:hypothetical protein
VGVHRAKWAPRHQALRAGVCQQPTVNTDDTGFRINGVPAFVMAFDTPASTVYQIRLRHRNEEVRELIPADYGGVMGTDRGKSYDAEELLAVAQQKCIPNIQRNVGEGALRYLSELRARGPRTGTPCIERPSTPITLLGQEPFSG